jgi:Ca2+-transporting ATPase
MADTPWHSLDVKDVLRELGSRPQGLGRAEANERLARVGRNEIAPGKPPSRGRLLLEQFASFYVGVLLFAAALAFAVSFLPGEGGRRLTAVFILGIVALSVLLSFFEEYRAQRELAALSRLLVFKAVVLRDGQPQSVDTAQVVPGDALILTHGQKVPADARVIEAHNLRVDESPLTGESLGIDKSPEAVPEGTRLAERRCMVYGSTYITQGTGMAVVVATGMGTEVGKIAASLQRMKERPTPFQREVQGMARQMTLIVGGLAIVVALILLFLLREPPVDVALNTLSLAVATIPESLPVVLTFALALGAHQMARRNAVVRRLAVVESLGSVDTICTDKTGTLTENELTVQRLVVDGRIVPLPPEEPDEATQAVLRAGLLCNDAAVAEGAEGRILGDPVDTAMLRAAQSVGIDVERERLAWPRVGEVPFDPARKMMTTVHRRHGGLIAYTKGAADIVLARCVRALHEGRVVGLDDAGRESLHKTLNALLSDGWYVLGLAQNEEARQEADPLVEEGLTLLGFEAMRDPARPEVALAIDQAHGAGIRVVMITGDATPTAAAMGKQLGIGARAIDAEELGKLSGPALREAVEQVDIVARATPDTKQHVLQALQDAGHFVAMTGDGVNDATALKQSDVGVAMGRRGTDIAKESAAMVLLDDNFATIMAAIEEGRRIFDNIRKFANYLLSTSLGEVLVVLALSAAGYFPLSAKMLLWVNVVTDLIPASALAADPAVPHVLKRRPRRHDEPILNKAIYATILGSILRTLVAYGLIFWVGLRLGGVAFARTMLFTGIVLHAFTRVMVVRQLDNLPIWSNRTLLWSYAAAVALQLVALYTPLREVFGIVPLDWRAWAVMAPVVAASSLAGVFMTRWILRLVPLWRD